MRRDVASKALGICVVVENTNGSAGRATHCQAAASGLSRGSYPGSIYFATLEAISIAPWFEYARVLVRHV